MALLQAWNHVANGRQLDFTKGQPKAADYLANCPEPLSKVAEECGFSVEGGKNASIRAAKSGQ